jgi:hypothetical protein
MNPAGDPTIFIPMGVHVGSPAVHAFINDHEENLIGTSISRRNTKIIVYPYVFVRMRTIIEQNKKY